MENLVKTFKKSGVNKNVTKEAKKYWKKKHTSKVFNSLPFDIKIQLIQTYLEIKILGAEEVLKVLAESEEDN